MPRSKTTKPVSDNKKALVTAEYLAGEGTMRALAKKHKIPRSTISDATKNPAIIAAAQPLLRRIETKLEVLADKLCDKYIEIADTASFEDKSTTALGIVLDKLLLIKGHATEITEDRSGLTVEAQEYLRSLVTRARAAGESDDRIHAKLLEKWPESVEYLGQVM